jgi:hypothetical protein
MFKHFLLALIPLSGVGTTCFSSCCNKDSAIFLRPAAYLTSTLLGKFNVQTVKIVIKIRTNPLSFNSPIVIFCAFIVKTQIRLPAIRFVKHLIRGDYTDVLLSYANRNKRKGESIKLFVYVLMAFSEFYLTAFRTENLTWINYT